MAGVVRSEEYISLNFNTGAAASGRKRPVKGGVVSFVFSASTLPSNANRHHGLQEYL